MKKLLLFLLCFGVLDTSFGQTCLDVGYKLRGYFYVGTSQVDTTALGGYYADNNTPKPINSMMEKISRPNAFQVIVQTDSIVTFVEKAAGFKVFIVNTSDSIVKLPAQDSRIYLKRQVFYKNEWQDIEYLPSSWCGNSYHSVFIGPNEYWDLEAPCIRGEIQAKFRFQLLVDNTSTLYDEPNIYSNEFNGSFNKSQLIKEEGHQPMGIMDPYDN
ncbi:hypothetical protein [Muricauda sp. MAR_2010_75]|jgi:hypothetical protein|uniref:hypothetical protein n=1 Tax=Allomuricauda sp. MAR_2010_75 TaxID=1250232 RepID=UPI00055D727B|nr:hypothetical protein [Muricauda sp. MAR_2010_75]